MKKQYGLLVCGLALLGAPVAGQQTRVETIEAERDKKAAKLEPDAPSKVEERLIYIKDAKVLERLTAGVGGLRIKLGGLGTGGGFGLGPQYLRDDLARGTMFVDASAQASTRQWVRLEAAMGQPKTANGRLFWEARTLHHNYNSLPFYGQGPESEKIRRTNYRLENTVADGMVGVHINRFVRTGFSSGYMWNNVGPGQDNRYASAEQVFRPAQAAGIDKQTNFFRWGAFAQLDFRDSKAGPRQGGNYSVRYDSYNDRDQRLHGFQRVDLEGQQYLPVFNKRRVFVLRGRVVMTKHDDDQTVPFYLQSVLGGSQDLRGFRPYRFYDENMMVMNAEYRWEVFSGMDMAIFADAGKVARRRSDLDFKNLESAVGFGMRFNARNATFIRIDVGFSHEGFQVWFKFNDVFAQRPFGSSAPSHIF